MSAELYRGVRTWQETAQRCNQPHRDRHVTAELFRGVSHMAVNRAEVQVNRHWDEHMPTELFRFVPQMAVN